MTEKNIEIMDRIVEELAAGKKIADALAVVYNKRSIEIPHKEELVSMRVLDSRLSNRTANALMRAKLETFADVIEYCAKDKVTSIKGLGVAGGIELFEVMLNHTWNMMTKDEKVNFLINAVERNEANIREELM